jgi:hypothetical protein
MEFVARATYYEEEGWEGGGIEVGLEENGWGGGDLDVRRRSEN